MALLSLLFLLIAIFLGFFRHMNTGLLAIGFSLVLGRLNGIPDKEVINGFNYSLFMILLGVTYLFSLAQLNGSLELLAKKVVALAGKHTFMIPIVIYVFSVVLSALGPGTVPTMAIMMVFSMALAAEMGINPAMLSALSVLGASGGGVSPLAATGIIGINLCAGFGLTGIEKQFLMNGILSSTVYGAIVYFLLGGYKLHSDKVISQDDIPPFNKNQIITLIGIGIMVILVLFFKVNVGLTGFAVAMVLSFLRVADEGEAIKKIPWGTLLLITGVGVLMHIIVRSAGERHDTGHLRNHHGHYVRHYELVQFNLRRSYADADPHHSGSAWKTWSSRACAGAGNGHGHHHDLQHCRHQSPLHRRRPCAGRLFFCSQCFATAATSPVYPYVLNFRTGRGSIEYFGILRTVSHVALKMAKK